MPTRINHVELIKRMLDRAVRQYCRHESNMQPTDNDVEQINYLCSMLLYTL